MQSSVNHIMLDFPKGTKLLLGGNLVEVDEARVPQGLHYFEYRVKGSDKFLPGFAFDNLTNPYARKSTVHISLWHRAKRRRLAPAS